MFVVLVQIDLHADQRARFLPLMLENARRSLAEEPGCHRFDVATDPDRPNEVLLYEVYTDASAFDAHLKTAHFQTFDQNTQAMIATKTLTTYRELAS